MKDGSRLPYAVVVGLEENGLGVARALAKEKIPCIGYAAPSWHPAWKTNSCEVVAARVWNKEAVIEDLIALGRTLEAKASLLITKDEPVSWISEARDELKPYFEINLPNKDTVDLMMDKQRFARLASEEGWPIPFTWSVSDQSHLLSYLKEVVYPCILKPATKNSYFRQNSVQKAFKIFDERTLVRTYEMVARWEKRVVIQEWIEGGDERVSFCLAYYNRNSHPTALFAGHKVRQYPIECGNTALSEPAVKHWSQKILDASEAIFQRVGYTGLGSIEFKMRLGNDQPVMIEPTVGRTDYQSEVAVLNGQNIPAIAYFDMVCGEQFAASSYLKPCKLVDGFRESRSAWQRFRTGNMTFSQWLKDRSGKKKYMLVRSSDMGPGVAAFSNSLGRFSRKIWKTIVQIEKRVAQICKVR
ncbi:MAG: hypothetical protein NTW07_08145 [candidate division Zixibacteria bacterium]|nr:hypothetical protein [candidate division Zixibacteria bacterium]